MSKNIVVCCDGTANAFASDRTNVIKLFYALEHRSPSQIAFYHPGLGTMEPPGALSPGVKVFTKLLGMAFGYGLPADIRDAYIFLLNNFEAGDRIYLFGFSRGAYTVRVLASMLHMYGLMPRGNEPLVPYAIRMMTASRSAERFALASEFTETFSTKCPVRFVGVWDTVSSVGWVSHPLKVPYTASNPSIDIGRQALAIDEKRAFFRQNLWHPKPSSQATSAEGGPRDLKQVWFSGAHCDIGGGYPETESGLAKLALEWMLGEASSNGLQLNRERTSIVLGYAGMGYAKPDPRAQRHESLSLPWWPAEFVPKRHFDVTTGKEGWRMNLFRRRKIALDALIHESVFQRTSEGAESLPPDAFRVASVPIEFDA